LALGCFVYFFVAFLVRLSFVAFLAEREASGNAWPWFFRVDEESAADVDFIAFWQGPPIVLMSFLCHTSILRLDEELRPEAKPFVGNVIRTVVFRIALPVYALVGLGGYALVGPGVSANILEDFSGDVCMAPARLMLGFMNMVKIPLGVVTLREEVLRTMPSSKTKEWLSCGSGRLVITGTLLASTSLIAYWSGSLTRILSFMGCTVGVLFSLCLPAALYWRLLRGQEPKHGADGLGNLRRPLLRGGRATGDDKFEAGITGAVDFPTDAAARLRHKLLCATVFCGGAIVGGLGLFAWLHVSQT